MAKLTLRPLTSTVTVKNARNKKHLTLASPTSEFFTDFNFVVKPITVNAFTPVINVLELLARAPSRIALVLNANDEFVGLISTQDVMESKIIQAVAAGTPRAEVLVEQLMTPKKHLLSLGISSIEYTTIADVIEVLKQQGNEHCIVVDELQQTIRGVLSAHDLSHKLNQTIDIHRHTDMYRTFAHSLAV